MLFCLVSVKTFIAFAIDTAVINEKFWCLTFTAVLCEFFNIFLIFYIYVELQCFKQKDQVTSS